MNIPPIHHDKDTKTSVSCSCRSRQMPFFYQTTKTGEQLTLCSVHSLPLLLLLLFKDFVGLQCHPLLMHQLLPVQLSAGLHCQPLLICHEQIAALRGWQQQETDNQARKYRAQRRVLKFFGSGDWRARTKPETKRDERTGTFYRQYKVM